MDNNCNCGNQAMHTVFKEGIMKRVCCRCYIRAGNVPASWHPNCMSEAGQDDCTEGCLRLGHNSLDKQYKERMTKMQACHRLNVDGMMLNSLNSKDIGGRLPKKDLTPKAGGVD